MKGGGFDFWDQVWLYVGMIVTGVVGWFTGRKKERAEIQNTQSLAKKTDAMTEGVRIDNEGRAIEQWRELYSLVQGEREKIETAFTEMKSEFQTVKRHHEECERSNEQIRREMEEMKLRMDKKKDR